MSHAFGAGGHGAHAVNVPQRRRPLTPERIFSILGVPVRCGAALLRGVPGIPALPVGGVSMGFADLFAVLCDCHVEVAEGFTRGASATLGMIVRRCDMDKKYDEQEAGGCPILMGDEAIFSLAGAEAVPIHMENICKTCELNDSDAPDSCALAKEIPCEIAEKDGGTLSWLRWKCPTLDKMDGPPALVKKVFTGFLGPFPVWRYLSAEEFSRVRTIDEAISTACSGVAETPE